MGLLSKCYSRPMLLHLSTDRLNWPSRLKGIRREKVVVTFDAIDKAAQNFQGLLNSSKVIFGQVIWTQRSSGSALYLEKCFFFLANLFPPRVLGQGVVIYLFGNRRTRQKNVGSGFKIWFYATFWFNATLRAYGVVNISLGGWINRPPLETFGP